MSENLTVVTQLSAHDEASPVIRGLLANVKKLEQSLKRFNSQFATFQSTGTSFGKQIADQHRTMSEQLRKSATEHARVADQHRSMWRGVYDDRLKAARSFHGELAKLETTALNRRNAAVRQEQLRHERAARSYGRPSGGAAIIAGTGLVAGGAVAIGARNAFKTRMKVDSAETNLQMFGGFASDEVKQLRKQWANQASIRFGKAINEVIDAYTEGAKAGIPKRYGKEFGEIILKSGAALELDSAATAKLAGRTATLMGDLKLFDPRSTHQMMNSVAVAARESAADAAEIVEANRRAAGALSASEMSPNDLSAFTSAGISTGLQPNKTGTFVGYLVSELVNARTAHGQRARDLDRASGLLGLGGRGRISMRAANDPTGLMLEIFERMQAMPEARRAQVADLLGQREWRDELLALSRAKEVIKTIIKAVAEDPTFLDRGSTQKLQSIKGRWDSVAAAFTLTWGSIGAGFESAFVEISDWFRENAIKLDVDELKLRVDNFVSGIKRGLGFDSWKSALDRLFRRRTRQSRDFQQGGKGSRGRFPLRLGYRSDHAHRDRQDRRCGHVRRRSHGQARGRNLRLRYRASIPCPRCDGAGLVRIGPDADRGSARERQERIRGRRGRNHCRRPQDLGEGHCPGHRADARQGHP
jgi:TP901 family phage tail tape measure protein